MSANEKKSVFGSGFKNEKLLFVFAALIVIIIYADTLSGPFIFDDLRHIRDNPHIRLTRISPGNLIEVVANGRSVNRPAANISFSLNYYFHRNNVVGYHLVNLLIHITSGLLLYLLVKTTLTIVPPGKLSRHGKWIPFFSALLWLTHPLQTQAVSYIVQRMTGMAAMFYLLSLWLYAYARITTDSGKKWLSFAGCILSGLLALGTKEISATLPFFIFLYEWLFFQRRSLTWLKRHAITLAALLVVFVVLGWMYLGTHPLDNIKMLYTVRHFTMGQRLLTELRVVVFYLGLLLWPHPSRLNLDHDFSLSYSLFQPPATALSLVLIVTGIFTAVYNAKRNPFLSFGIIWFFGNLMIESSVVGLELVFEHRTYLPSMLAISLGVAGMFRFIKPQWLTIALLCVLTTVGSVWTYQRNSVWTDEVLLWRDSVKKSPQKARVYTNLATALARNGNITEALANYHAAIKLKKNYAEPHYSIGVILARQGNLEEGIQYMRKALKIEPNNPTAQINLGVALLSRGDLDQAAVHLQYALQIRPDYPEAYNNLGRVQYLRGNVPEAVAHYNAALRLNPNYAKAHNNLGLALIQMDRPAEARHHFEEALRLYPGYEDARRNLEETATKKMNIEHRTPNIERQTGEAEETDR